MNALADAVMRNFNPRSPCGERLENKPTAEELTQFQSTLPVWGATVYVHRYGHRHGISIHAPRVGSDTLNGTSTTITLTFQSTLPVWGATAQCAGGWV